MKKIFIIALFLSICSFFLIQCENCKDKDKEIQELKQQLEKKTRAATESKSLFYLLIGISIAFVLIAIIIGVAMGSKARKDANNQSNFEKGDSDERE